MGFGSNANLQAVRAAADVQVGDAVHALGAEDADEAALPRDDRAVVDSGDPRKRPAADDWVSAVAPDRVRVARRPWLPWNVRQGRTDNL